VAPPHQPPEDRVTRSPLKPGEPESMTTASTLCSGVPTQFVRRAASVALGLSLGTAGFAAFQARPSQAAVRTSNPMAAATKLCKGIPAHDLGPLFSGGIPGGPNLGPAPNGAAVCGFPTAGSTYSKSADGGTFAVVEIAVGVGGALYLENRDTAKGHSLSGIGQKATWALAAGSPQMVAQRGNVSCLVVVSGDFAQTTLTYAMKEGNPVVTPAATKAYALKMGAVCKDVFKGK
jgi:hypothetical protein